MTILSRLFGKPAVEEKASSVGAMITRWTLGRAVWTQRDFARLAREGYQRNVIVYACVWMTARACADVPLAIMRTKGTTDNVETTDPRLEALLNRPNPLEDGVAWRQGMFSDFLLGANAFAERVDVGGIPRELYRWRPDRTRVVPGPLGFPQAYEFNVGGEVKRVDVDIPAGNIPVMHWRDYNPTDDFYGMSAIDPAAFAVDSHTGAVAWNKALLDNSAQPSGALVYAPKEGSGKLTDEQWSRLKAELDQTFSGAQNAGRPLLLDGGLDWKEMGLSPKEMSFVDGKNSAARDIALAIGVPPLMLGIQGDNTYANYAEANKAFYRQTVLPLVGQFCRVLNYWLVPSFGKNLRIEADVDDLPVFADERAALWDRIEKSTILTTDEKREMLGFGKYAPTEDPGGKILVQSTIVPLESASIPPEERPLPEDDDENNVESGDDEAGEVEEETDDEKSMTWGGVGDPRRFFQEWLVPSEDDALKRGYNPEQPRHPVGSSQGGQWSGGGIGDALPHETVEVTDAISNHNGSVHGKRGDFVNGKRDTHIGHYTGEISRPKRGEDSGVAGAYDLNEYLHNGTLPKHIKTPEQKARLDRQVSELQAHLNSKTLVPGTVLYRGQKHDPHLKVGDTYEASGFTSTSTSVRVANAYQSGQYAFAGYRHGGETADSVLFEIRGAKHGVATNKHELEVILNHGAKYRVTGVKTKTYKLKGLSRDLSPSHNFSWQEEHDREFTTKVYEIEALH